MQSSNSVLTFVIILQIVCIKSLSEIINSTRSGNHSSFVLVNSTWKLPDHEQLVVGMM